MSRILAVALTASCLVCSWVSARAQANTQVNPPADFPSGAPPVLDLPQIGDPADTALSPAQSNKLGEQVVAEMYRYDFILEDPELQEYISSMGWRLAAAAGAHNPNLEWFVVKDPRINAFALPGGHMGFNAGLITASDSESEMAGVMSHELAHVTQNHIARSAADQSGVATWATWLAVLAAIIAGSGDPDVILGALAIGQSTSYQRQVSYTRSNEMEADRIGIGTMAAAGFDPVAMASFFQKLEQESRLYGSGTPEILRTHPVNTTRVAEALARAANMPKRTVSDSIEYSLMKARTQVFAADQPSDAVESFSTFIASGHDTPANRYGLAFALQQLGQAQKAMQVLAPTLEKYPRQANLNLLQAQLLIDGNESQKGFAIYEKMLALYPRFSPAILEYSEALIAAGKSDQARQVLITHDQAFGTRLDTYRLLAQAAHDMDNDAEASYQMANFMYLRGDPGGALSQLDAGLRIASLSSQDRARLAARRAEVRESLPRNFNPEAEQRRGGNNYGAPTR